VLDRRHRSRRPLDLLVDEARDEAAGVDRVHHDAAVGASRRQVVELLVVLAAQDLLPHVPAEKFAITARAASGGARRLSLT
jgi:hypothetical protein